MRPPLIGPISLANLLADRADYREAARRYEPDAISMKTIHSYGKEIVLDIFFGSWCSHCQMYMPKILRVARDADNPRLKVDLIGVPRNFGGEKGPWSNKGITTIPVIIVRKDGKEITRLSTHEGALPEVELAQILQALK